MTGAGLSGVAATQQYVVVADRDPLDHFDVFRCLDAQSGQQLWQIQYAAPGNLDYGNSPRATPVIRDGLVYLLGAFGDLHCVTLAVSSSTLSTFTQRIRCATIRCTGPRRQAWPC